MYFGKEEWYSIIKYIVTWGGVNIIFQISPRSKDTFIFEEKNSINIGFALYLFIFKEG